MMRPIRRAVMLLGCTILLGTVRGGETWIHLPLAEVTVIEGEIPSSQTGIWDGMSPARRSNLARHFQPCVAFDDDASRGWISFGEAQRWMPRRPINPERVSLLVHTTAQPPVEGRMLLPSPDWGEASVVRFRIDEFPADPAAAREAVLEAELEHNERLAWIGGPGSAWFSWHASRLRRELSDGTSEEATMRPVRGTRGSDLESTMDLMSGGRAMSENLAFDRVLDVDESSTETLKLADIVGVSTPEYDWQSEIEDLDPATDALAELVPADCLAVFFPDFAAMTAVIDDGLKTDLATWGMDTLRPTDELVFAKYERQLVLPLNDFTARLGEALVDRVALCSEDPFFPTGTSVAVLFETKKAEGLVAAIVAQYAMTSLPVEVSEIGGAEVRSVRNAERTVCSYVATTGGHVVVSNSPDLVRRIVSAGADETPSVADTPEYTFFRDRYPADAEGEDALVVATDAAIRKWTGPKWRIATSRRTRAAARLLLLVAEETAARGGRIGAEPRPLESAGEGFDVGDVRVTETAILSSVYGTPGFLSPVAEMDVDEVNKSEADAYDGFRRSYERQWRNVFDPIAVSVGADDDGVTLDVTVRPLMARSDYGWYMEMTGSRRLTDAETAMHGDTIARFAMALDPESRTVAQVTGLATGMIPTLGANPLNWVSGWFAMDTEANAFWDGLAEASESKDSAAVEDYVQERFTELPVVIGIGSSNALKLTAFVAAMRGFIEQSAPEMTVWETRKAGEIPYVRVGATERAQRNLAGETVFTDPALYYAVMPEALVLSLNEEALRKSIQRLEANATEEPANDDEDVADASDGPSMSLAMRSEGTKLVERIARESVACRMQSAAWSNVHVLNALSRDAGIGDPVSFMETWWGERPVSPGGGEYVWNEEMASWESTDFGSPWSPKPGTREGLTPLAGIGTADMKVTFEEDGLRAVGRIGYAGW